MPTTLADIHDFFAQRRIALIGLSRDEKDFSRMMFRELSNRGYDVLPVNPAAAELEGRRCFARMQDIQPPPDAALVMTPPSQAERVVRDCAEAGVRRVWLHRGGGQGSVSPQAVEFCRSNGLRLVEGYCPFMFLPRTQFVHRVHGFFMKIFGAWPPRPASAGPCGSLGGHDSR